MNKIRAQITPCNGLSASDLLSAIAKEGPRLGLIPEDDELVLFRSIRKIKSATINRIPKSCTFSFVRTYSSLLEKVIANPQCLDSLFLFYFFPRAVLTKVKTGAVSKCKWKRRQQEARAYQDNIDTWNNGPEGIWSLLLKLLNGKFSSTNAPNQFFNAQKCKDLISEGRFTRDQQEWNRFPKEVTQCDSGTDLLGCPIGNNKEYLTNFIMKRVNKIKDLISKVHLLDDLHCQYLLLKNCIGMPKFNFALRCVKPELILDASKEFDAAMDRATVDLVGNGKLSKSACDVLFLPISLGGVGFSKASQTSHAAYTGSIFQSLQLQSKMMKVDEDILLRKYSCSLDEVNSNFDDENKLSITDFRSIRHPQQFLSEKLNEISLQKVCNPAMKG